LKLGGSSGTLGSIANIADPTERLDLDGNIRYTGTLKPLNVAPTTGQFLKADSTSTNVWAAITPSDISGLESSIRGSISATTPLVYDDFTGDFSILRSSSIANGYLHQDDWNFFNEKQGRIILYPDYDEEIDNMVLVTDALSFRWKPIVTSMVTNLSDYTGFDARYFTQDEIEDGYQPLDADLTAIAGLAGTSGYLKKTAANTWSLDTSTFLTSITLTGDITGSGTTSIATTLATVNSNVGTFRSVTVNAKGLVTAATNPTTLAGYGITDVYTKTESDARFQAIDGDLTAIAALSGTSGVLVKTGVNTWSLDTTSYLTVSTAASTYLTISTALYRTY